jgi:putative (di)nucleoside polyphosphate hydrolase
MASATQHQQGTELLAKDLILADMQHFGESLWRNEEVGEKRFEFFITLLTAVAGGLVALGSAEHGPKGYLFRSVAGLSSLAVLILGFLSYLRMIQRNRVRDEYQDTLRFLRQRYVTLCPELQVRSYEVPFRRPSSGRLLGRSGYAETLAIINGIVLVATLVLLANASVLVATICGSGFALLLWQHATKQEHTPAEYFRAGVGAIIVNAEGLVIGGERMNAAGSWQFPQGGMELGEDPLEAAYREIDEETGLSRDDLDELEKFPSLVAYELPPSFRSSKTGRGQVQQWFFFKVKASAEGQQLICRSGEYRTLSWCSFREIATQAVGFKKPVYDQLLRFYEQRIVKGRS